MYQNWSYKLFKITSKCLCQWLHTIPIGLYTLCLQQGAKSITEKALYGILHMVFYNVYTSRETLKETASLSPEKTVIHMFLKHISEYQSCSSTIVNMFAHPKCFKQCLECKMPSTEVKIKQPQISVPLTETQSVPNDTLKCESC